MADQRDNTVRADRRQAATAVGQAYVAPLRGVRVIDMTSVFMGPLTTQHLADLGADVIKVEAPAGDSTRRIGPGSDRLLGAPFLGLNRNKRSVVLDLKRAPARDALLALAKTADVLVYNVRPKAMERLGLGYETLAAANPGLIYAGLTGFSQRGRNAPLAAFDDLIQAATGLSDLIGRANRGDPSYLPMTVADRTVGTFAFGIIAAALYGRTRDGKGHRVEIPMYETMLSLVLGDHLYGETFIPARGTMTYPRLMSSQRKPYRTADGFICCTVYTDAHWRSFLSIVGKPSLMLEDPRFADMASRTRHIDALYAMVAEEFALRPTAEWVARLGEADIPSFVVPRLEDLIHDPHLGDIGFFEEHDHPLVGRIRQMKNPAEWDATGIPTRSLAPGLGEHTRDVLNEAGLSPAAIDALLACGAAVQQG